MHYNLLNLNTLELLKWSCIYNIFLIAPLFTVAAIQDAKYHEVENSLCIALGGSILIHACLFSTSIIPALFVIACLIGTFILPEIERFGQADFLLIAHFMTGYTNTLTGTTLLIGAGIIWLLCLLVHALTYKDEEGRRWKPFSHTMIPAIPSYSFSIAIVNILRIIFTEPIFYAGW